MTDHPLVRVAISGGVATLTLDRASKRNALDRALMESIAAALDAVRDDPAARVVVIRGDGPVFSAGIDHGFLLEVFQKAREVPFAHVHHDLQDTFNRLERMGKPTIAAIHRAAVGMAFELALACDFRVVTADTVVGLPEIAFGIVPDVGGTTRLVRCVGPVKAKDLILTGRLVGAAEAERLGLVTEVASDEQDLAARVATLAGRLARHSPTALGMAKGLVQAAADADQQASLRLEGTVQQVLMKQPDLAERFPAALAFIKEEMARASAPKL